MSPTAAASMEHPAMDMKTQNWSSAALNPVGLIIRQLLFSGQDLTPMSERALACCKTKVSGSANHCSIGVNVRTIFRSARRKYVVTWFETAALTPANTSVGQNDTMTNWLTQPLPAPARRPAFPAR
jgi:hypothetical protein